MLQGRHSRATAVPLAVCIIGSVEEVSHSVRAAVLRAPEILRPRQRSWSEFWGLRKGVEHPDSNREFSNSLASRRDLARSWMSRLGLSVHVMGDLPSGGTILLLDELDLGKALVLLSIFEQIRAYLPPELAADDRSSRELGIRTLMVAEPQGALATLVDDLSSDRVVLMDRSQYRALRRSRQLLTGAREAEIHYTQLSAKAGGVDTLVRVHL